MRTTARRSYRRRMIRTAVALTAAAALASLAACGGSTAKVTLSGDLTLPNITGASDTANLTSPEGSGVCSGTGGYDDLTAGAPVTVEDAAGKVIGTATLGSGQLDGTSVATYTCVWKFTVTGLPSSGFYKVGVSRRGTISYSLAQVKAGQVHLSLGAS